MSVEIRPSLVLRSTPSSTTYKSGGPSFPNDRGHAVDEDIHELTPQAAAYFYGWELSALGAKYSTGLSSAVVSAKQGTNRGEKKTEKKYSELARFLDQFLEPYMVLLSAASVLCFVIHSIDPAHDPVNLYVGLLLMFLVVVTSLFSYLESRIGDNVMSSFDRLMAATAHVIRDGVVTEVPAKDVVTGDLILLRAGEKCAADIRLLEVEGLKTDNSSMTGESEPVHNVVHRTSDVAVQSRNMCWSSSLVVEGTAFGVVTAVGSSSRFCPAARLAGAAKTPKYTFSLEVIRLVKFSSALSVFVALLVAAQEAARRYPALAVAVTILSVLNGAVLFGFLPAPPPLVASVVRLVQYLSVKQAPDQGQDADTVDEGTDAAGSLATTARVISALALFSTSLGGILIIRHLHLRLVSLLHIDPSEKALFRRVFLYNALLLCVPLFISMLSHFIPCFPITRASPFPSLVEITLCFPISLYLAGFRLKDQ